MKSISLKVLCALGLVFGLAFFGLAAESEAAASLQAAETTQPTPSGSKGMVGVWIRENPFTPIDKATQWIEFKADGTFNSYWLIKGISGSGWLNYTFSDPGTLTERGSYSVSGNKITLTNVLSTWKAKNPSTAMTKDFTDKSSSNMSWDYENLPAGDKKDAGIAFSEYGILKISAWASAGATRYYKPRTASGIELFPQTLPSFYCPTGFNGVTQSDVIGKDMTDIASAFGSKVDGGIKFYITINNTNLNALQSYRSQLTSNGYAISTLSDTWILRKDNVTVNGHEYYRVDISALGGVLDNSVIIRFTFWG